MTFRDFIRPRVRSSAQWKQNLHETLRRSAHAPALECGDSSPLLAGDSSPSNFGARTIPVKRQVHVICRAALRGAAGATSRPSEKSGDKSPHSKVWGHVPEYSPVIASFRARAPAPAMECDDWSSLFEGDWSPSNVVGWALPSMRVPRVIRRAALRGAAGATGRPSGKSGDESPHSIERGRLVA